MPHVFFETDGDVGQAVTDLAYALVQKRIEDKKRVQISSLAPHDFRALLQTVLETDALNDMVKDGHVVDEEFGKLLARIQPLHRTLPEWHELTFLLG